MPILSNTYESFVDDLSSDFIYKESKTLFQPLQDKFNSDNATIFDNAISSAITTLHMGISQSAMTIVNQYLIDKMIKVGGSLFSYITIGSIVQGAKSKFKKRLLKARSRGLKGKALKLFMGSFDTPSRSDRIQESKLAMSFFSDYSSVKNSKENQLIKSRTYLRNGVTPKNSTDPKLELYTFKTKTGTWKNTQEDRLLYEKVLNSKLVVSWSKMYLKLNSFSEYASDTEEKVVNLAQTNLDLLASMGYQK